MIRWRLVLMTATLATLLSSCSLPVTGLYSNMRFVDGSVSGLEVFLVEGPGNSYYVTIQCADGEAGVPAVLAATLDFQTLTLPVAPTTSRCPKAPFRAEINGSEMVGGFVGSSSVVLERRKSIWQ